LSEQTNNYTLRDDNNDPYSSDDFEGFEGNDMDDKDNAGDANTSGDGSASLENKFLEYGSEDEDSDDESNGNGIKSKSKLKNTNAMPREKLEKMIVSKPYLLLHLPEPV
jgi:hypothetical protein